MQPLALTAGKPGSTPLLSVANYYCSGTALECSTNNGNVQSQTIGVNSTTPQYTQSFAYHSLNRLKKASESSAWEQTYVYDAFGNRALLSGGYIPLWPAAPQGTADTGWTNYGNVGNYSVHVTTPAGCGGGA